MGYSELNYLYPSTRSKLHKLVPLTLVLVLGSGLALSTWYFLARRSLPCASSAGSNWGLTLTDRGVANQLHFRWYIKPVSNQATETFVACLAERGFKIHRESKGISAVRGDETISTGDGAGFPNPGGRFERW